jgi:hypothetical protein
MKNNWHIDAMDYLLFALTILGILLVILSHRVKNDVENIITTTDTIVINDTIVDMEYDTCYLWKKDTVKLPIVVNDTTTLIKIDSVLVEVPISVTVYDTTIKDSNYRTSLRAVLSGFRCSLDTLCMETEIMQQQPKKQPWYNNIVPAIGLGYGTSGFGIFAGVGYKLN